MDLHEDIIFGTDEPQRRQQQPSRITINGWIPCDRLPNLQEYEYVRYEKTYFSSQILDKVWEAMMICVPKFIAPNLITLTGLLVVLIGVILLFIQEPTMTGHASFSTYLYLAIAIWLYQTLDSLDGKQARRTGTSSALGEFLDHGCDAVVIALLAIMTCHLLSTGVTYSTGILISSQVGIYTIFTYEKRFTHKSRPSTRKFGVIEVHYLYIVLCLLRYLLGCNLPLLEIGFLSDIFHITFNFRNLVTWTLGFLLILAIFLAVPNAYKYAKHEGRVYY